MNRTKQIAVILAIITMILALSAALIKFIRFNEVDLTLIGAGIAIPAVVISIASITGSGKK